MVDGCGDQKLAYALHPWSRVSYRCQTRWLHDNRVVLGILGAEMVLSGVTIIGVSKVLPDYITHVALVCCGLMIITLFAIACIRNSTVVQDEQVGLNSGEAALENQNEDGAHYVSLPDALVVTNSDDL
ncbi:MAG: hypothetical protein SP4CHLAM5_10930 [Chlamydiia bacterium]|nr:hypothetical protein [Chlamydiia bacterium]MCH9618950.1 hypothetical protein [Chlamydiia bacterium]MCH9624708.1 hypothetical protein [Chlamydiia bacterium]